MNKHKFSKPPLDEKENRMKAFVNLTDSQISVATTQQPEKIIPKKERTKSLYFRVPESLWNDIHEITTITGLSMKAILLALLRPEIKRKLKELKES